MARFRSFWDLCDLTDWQQLRQQKKTLIDAQVFLSGGELPAGSLDRLNERADDVGMVAYHR